MNCILSDQFPNYEQKQESVVTTYTKLYAVMASFY